MSVFQPPNARELIELKAESAELLRVIMDLFRDRRTADEFLSCVGGLLGKVDAYLDTIETSQTVDTKRLELIENLKFMKSYFLTNQFPEQLSRLERTDADRNNNNNAAVTSTDDQHGISSPRAKFMCLCTDFENIRLVPKLLDISAGRRLHFSSQLLHRMAANRKFAVCRNDFLVKECQGWLSVDEQHKFYARISDCLFCLFEKDESETALMTLILNDSRTQETASSKDRHAFTITTQHGEALYFSAESAIKRTEWICWLNVGAQLPFTDLIDKLDTQSFIDSWTQTEVEKPIETRNKATGMLQTAQKSDMTDSGVQTRNDVHMREKIPMLRRQARTNHRTQSIIDDNAIIRTKMKENLSLRPASSYDWSLDQGTSRHFPLITELQRDIRVRKAVSFSEGLSSPAHVSQTRPVEGVQPGYLHAVDKRALYSQKSASLDSRNSTNRMSRFVQRASSFFTGKSQSFTLPARNKRQPITSRNSIQADKRTRMAGDAILSARNSGISSVDMAGLCEIQGYLLFKKPLKWSSYYCCVYNGTFSCFKDQTTSLPEIQCQLRECQVRPVKGKRPFTFKLISSNKSAYFAAASNTDLHSWYNIFNNYIQSALALSRHRGGGYAMWQWTGEGYIDPEILTNSIAKAYHNSIDDEEYEAFCCDESDCSHLEKTSADGASNHSVESDGPVRGADRRPSSLHETEHAPVGARSGVPESPAMRSVSESEYRRYRFSRVARGDKSLSQFYCKSVDDIPSFSSSLSSSGDDEVCGDSPVSKSKKSREERRKDLLDKMMKEKLKIERALEQQKRRDDEEKETERLVNRTKLQQRRVSTQLKYDFLEKQLQEKREDKSRYGVFQRGNKVDKPGKHIPAAVTDNSGDSNQHIRRQMDELKRKLDCLDKGLSETTHHGMKGLPAQVQRVGFPQDMPVDPLSQHKLRGLESIIETLEAPKHQPSPQPEFSNENNNCKRCSVVSEVEEKANLPKEIRPETLVVISEFETMIHELVSRRPSVNYEQQ